MDHLTAGWPPAAGTTDMDGFPGFEWSMLQGPPITHHGLLDDHWPRADGTVLRMAWDIHPHGAKRVKTLAQALNRLLCQGPRLGEERQASVFFPGTSPKVS